MDVKTKLGVVRRAYAKQVLTVANVRHPTLEKAFGSVHREDFLGDGPWWICCGDDYARTVDTDPVVLYCDALFALLPDRKLNNGQPSFHAQLIAAVNPKRNEHVVHIGAGTGYFTAILAQLVGPAGKVTAVELESELATRANANLSTYRNVEIISGDGTSAAFGEADVIYVTAGATQFVDNWLDRLNDGGRLLIPLTSDRAFYSTAADRIYGSYFLIDRREHEYTARWICNVGIYPCESARNATSEAALTRAFESGRWKEVTRLYRDGNISDDRIWCRWPNCVLAYW